MSTIGKHGYENSHHIKNYKRHYIENGTKAITKINSYMLHSYFRILCHCEVTYLINSIFLITKNKNNSKPEINKETRNKKRYYIQGLF